MSQPYPRYRASGVDELPPLPAHWTCERLKHLCKVFPSNVDKHTLEDERPVSLCNYTDVYYRDWITADIDFMSATATETEIERFSLRVGDTIFTKDSETADDIGVTALVVEELPGVVCGYHLSIARPRERAFGGYLKRFFDSTYAKAMFETRANGLTRVGLGQYAVDNVPIPVPPLDEQRAIAAFLDRETGKIDALVEEQRRLIALLKEKRQAVISHAVTKGLDPTTPLKPSGIDWLGDIPTHWSETTLRRVLVGIEQGWSPVADDREPEKGEIGVLRLSAIKHGRFFADQCKALVAQEDDERVIRSLLREADLLLTRANTPDLVGDCAIVTGLTGPTIFSDLIYRLIIDETRVIPAFLLLLLRSDVVRSQIKRDARGSSMSMAKLSHGHIKSWLMALPPKEEQADIVDFVRQEIAKLDALIAEAETAIALLQERRSALISAAVTGKIDVRALVPDATEAA